jgi:hypothetical protein
MLYAPTADSLAHRRLHQESPLRLPQAEVNALVETVPLACTHFDAFRFFTPRAAPLNRVEPTPSRAAQPALEQPGCVHVSMDLFRYAVKLWPWVPAELVADTFELALEARVLDMRASPYDLSRWEDGGFELSPVRVETADGRREYQRAQSRLAMRAAPVRAQLVREYEAVCKIWDSEAEEGGSD